MLIVYIAFNPKKIKELIKETIIFYLISFIFGGVMFSLIFMVKPQKILMKNSLIQRKTKIKIIYLGTILSILLIKVTTKILKNKINNKCILYEIKIKIKEKEAKTIAMLDTGNLLKEPITGNPVIIVEKNIMKKIIPNELIKNTEKILGGDTKQIKEEYLTKLKIIPYSSLGNQQGILLGIKSDEISINKDKKTIKKNNIIIGMCNQKLNKENKYSALIGTDIIN